MSEHDRYENQVGEGERGVAYDVIAVLIFSVVAYTFLFPVNRIVPLDRRTVAIAGATMTYITRSFLFPHKDTLNIIGMIDFDVLILLSAIMIINHIFVHLKEVKRVVKMIQNQIKINPRRGFWLVSLAAFTISPFLTNDGVCLLMVEIVLAAFDGVTESNSKASTEVTLPGDKLVKEDALYFLLTLACSANIGSALTYTGNPQNMIVASVATDVLSPGVFFAVMLLPSIVGWLLTTYWIEYKWKQSKLSNYSSCTNVSLLNKRVKCACVSSEMINDEAAQSSPEKQLLGPSYDNAKDTLIDIQDTVDGTTSPMISRSNSKLSHSNSQVSLKVVTKGYVEDDNGISVVCSSPLGRGKKGKKQLGCVLSCVEAPAQSPEKPPSSNRIDSVKDKIVHIISSPVPYFIIILLVVMIIMIFVDVMSISGLVCVTAMSMVIYLVISNHWAGTKLWEEAHTPLHQTESKDGLDDIILPANPTFEQRAHALNDFFEDLFESIDWNLLLIFLGTFIIVANVDSTGIPRQLWNGIVGKRPFDTASSVIGISVFVLLSSQLLGNVAVIQLARPNVEMLDDDSRRYAWAIISFVATVGGNLTITGSAANIIVAEKAVRIDPSSSIDFFKHYNICFWITLLSCAVGAVILSLIICLSNI